MGCPDCQSTAVSNRKSKPRWATRPSAAGPANTASTNEQVRPSTTSSSPPISCGLPACGACATNSAFTMWLSSSCNGASRSATRPSGRGSSGLRQWSLTVCAQSVVVRSGVHGTWTKPTSKSAAAGATSIGLLTATATSSTPCSASTAIEKHQGVSCAA